MKTAMTLMNNRKKIMMMKKIQNKN